MVGSGNCVYETPCGWCSKWDKKCDRKIGTATQKKENMPDENDIGKITAIETNMSDALTQATNIIKRCGTCMNADRDSLYSPNPSNLIAPNVRCNKTARWHSVDDICDCDTITATN